jgi:fatty-acyl-CoA synthase
MVHNLEPLMTIGDWIKKWGLISPPKTAIIFEGVKWSYRALNERANRLGNLLVDLGIQKGDRVAVLLYNCPQYIETYTALAKVGAIIVPLNFRLAQFELASILNDSGSETLLFGKDFEEEVRAMRPDIPVKDNNYICVGEKTPPWSIDYEKALMDFPGNEPEVKGGVNPGDSQMIMYTSGTTGISKGALLSHRKSFFNALNANVYYGLTSEDIMLVTRALFNSGGSLVECFPMLYKGGAVILQRRFNPKAVLEAIGKYRVTVLEAAATMYRMILDECDISQYDLTSLKVCYTGGERIPLSLLREYQKKNITIGQIFGLTETSTVTWLGKEDAVRKMGSVGRPVLHGEMRIVDEKGKDIRAGAVGEIIVRGSIIMDGYWNKPRLTEETIRKGWLYTGDLATIDEEGFVYIKDRKKDMFISGGMNVYPAEIEKIYLGHPKVNDVAVIGVPDQKWGEVGKAFIVLKEGQAMTAQEAIDFCREKIAKYKIPKSIQFVEKLPKTAGGKIRKYLLK